MFQYTVVASTLVVFLFIPSFLVKKETVFQKITHSNGSEMRKKRTLCIGMMNRDRSWRREKMGEDWKFVERRKEDTWEKRDVSGVDVKKLICGLFSLFVSEKRFCHVHYTYISVVFLKLKWMRRRFSIWILNVQLTIWTVVFDSCNFFPETISFVKLRVWLKLLNPPPLKFRVWI